MFSKWEQENTKNLYLKNGSPNYIGIVHDDVRYEAALFVKF